MGHASTQQLVWLLWFGWPRDVKLWSLVCSGVGRAVVASLSRGHQEVAAGPGLAGGVGQAMAGAG